MSDHQHEDHAVDDLDVPTSDAAEVKGGIGNYKKLEPSPNLKIDNPTNARFSWGA